MQKVIRYRVTVKDLTAEYRLMSKATSSERCCHTVSKHGDCRAVNIWLAVADSVAHTDVELTVG